MPVLLQVVHGLAGDVAGIAAVVFPGDRVLDVADHRQRGDLAEWVERGGLRLRHHQHVALVDRLPAADAGAVEAQAVLEDVLVELVDGNGEVLPNAGEVHEPQIDGLDILFPTQRQYLFGSHELVLSSKRGCLILGAVYTFWSASGRVAATFAASRIVKVDLRTLLRCCRAAGRTPRRGLSAKSACDCGTSRAALCKADASIPSISAENGHKLLPNLWLRQHLYFVTVRYDGWKLPNCYALIV